MLCAPEVRIGKMGGGEVKGTVGLWDVAAKLEGCLSMSGRSENLRTQSNNPYPLGRDDKADEFRTLQ